MKVASKKAPPPAATPKTAEPSAKAPPPTTGSWAPLGRVAPQAVVNSIPLPFNSDGICSVPFDLKLDAETHSHNVKGNDVKLLFDGVSSFAERRKLIDSATSSISLQTFIFNSDATGWAMATQLADKAKQGVQVRVIYDAVGSGRTDPHLFEMMKKAGVQVLPYGEKWKLWELNDRWHEKHLIVDGKVAINGGMNIANEYAYGGSNQLVTSRGKLPEQPWRDCDIRVEGPAVHEAAAGFLSNWRDLGGKVTPEEAMKLLPPLTPMKGPGTPVRIVQNNPALKNLKGNGTKLYLRAIESSKTEITIENAYFLPPPEVRRALKDAAKRGVNVRVLTNSRASNDNAFVSDAARYFYDDLMKAGVHIYEKQGGTLHAKTASFDHELGIVGSINLNGRSDHLDSEVAVVVEDKATADSLDERFLAGLKQARPVTKAELAHEGFITNLRQWALSKLAWTF